VKHPIQNMSGNKLTPAKSKVPVSFCPRVHISTLGCSKNVYDSEILLGQLKANGAELIAKPEEADVIIINSCGFILPAKEESIQAILEAVEHKKNKKNLKILVCGCLSARYYTQLQKQIPEVDAYFGTEDFSSILNYLNLPIKNDGHLYQDRLLTTKPHFAYLKISEGCNHGCAFCAIPLMRGRHRSRPLAELVREAEILIQRGVKEIILIAQDTTFYGLDLYNKQCLIDLLEKLERLKGLEWIRIHYAYPTTFQDELIEVMAASDKIVHYVDLPIQHISDKMLKIMKRGGTAQRIRQILENLRQRIPRVAIRSTLIVGHPGETAEDFLEMRKFVEEFKFDRLGAFIYSPEENTAAYKLSAPARTVAEERYNEIMMTQQHISRQKNESLIGKTMRVIVDEYDAGTFTASGRTYADSPEIDNEVFVQKKILTPKPGEFYYVRITDATEYELSGEILEKK
jgi:ribosomal protein S12 methylthiotransferase